MEKSIDERDDKGYITTANLVAFFGEGTDDLSEVLILQREQCMSYATAYSYQP